MLEIRTPSRAKRRRTASVFAAVLVAGAAGCSDNAPTGPSPIDTRTNEVVLTWNEHAFDAIMAHDEYANPLAAARIYAIVHLAQHDALNAIDPIFESYAFDGYEPDADPVAAAAAAAHGVLTALFPEQHAALDGKLHASLNGAGAEATRARGVALGEQAALAILERRANDGSDTPIIGDYTPGEGPGRYQLTPPFPLAFAPGWRHVEPFTMPHPAHFRLPAPPALTSTAYAEAFNEVRTLGRIDSTERTAEQTSFAAFWYEFSEIGWNRIARTVAAERGLGLQSSARLFALLNMAMSDAYVAGWDSKYHYDFWRPYTAIRAAGSDGNGATVADAEWEPALPTPPVQDYPSTHSALGNAAAAVLASVFGDATSFTFGSSTAEPAGTVRSFTSFSQAADENAESRVMAGLHFRFACEAGQELGRQVGERAAGYFLRQR